MIKIEATGGVSSTTGSAAPNLLRPSAFGASAAAGGVIAPSRFQASANPWMSQTPDSTESAVSSSDNASKTCFELCRVLGRMLVGVREYSSTIEKM